MTTMNHEYKRQLVQQLESSVDFLTHKRKRESVESDEYRKLTKELAAATTELYKARAAQVAP